MSTTEIKWPETRVERLTEEQYKSLIESNIGMTAYDTCDLLTKIKIVVRSLQVEKLIDSDMGGVCDVMISEFILQLQRSANPDTIVNVDEIFGRLLGHTAKVCLASSSVQVSEGGRLH